MSSHTEREPIAIVGIGCLLPGGVRGPESFWNLLCDGVDAITPIPASRWNSARYVEGENPLMHVAGGGFLDDISGFDAPFFGISPREASAMDPQQRMLLEVTWEALEDAGIVPEHLAGSAVSVYAGAFAMDYKLLQLNPSEHEQIGVHSSTGISATLVANRISHWFDLRGASVSLDTACSSSMTALHLACQDLRRESSDVALVAGVNAIFYPEWTLAADRGGYLSADGRCKTFSANADGYGRGEGVGVMVLKPLSKARADGDRIYALVCGTAINQDGHTAGITVPRSDAQEAVMRAACEDAQISPQDVGYVEAHGTGTPVGDPIEVAAIGRVYGKTGEDQRCLIGSVKTNIGHLEAAAGVAGVIKAALCLHNKMIPASLHYECPNPAISFESLGVKVMDQAGGFPSRVTGRCVGVNSFGFGGANGHAVLRECVEEDSCCGALRCGVLPLSARSPEALKRLASAYANSCEKHSLNDLCYTAAVRRQHHDFRMAFAVREADELQEALRNFAASDQAVPVVRKRNTAFIFSGMGSQWFGMGRVLFETDQVFRETAIAFDVYFAELSGWSLLDILIRGKEDDAIDRTAVAQPAIVLIQAALYEMLRSRGVVPDSVAGHSLGELTAVYAAGGISLQDLVSLVYHRSRLQASLEGCGGMLAVGLSIEDVDEWLSAENGVDIAAVNGPFNVTLAGPVDALTDMAAQLAARQVFNRMLRVAVPYHSVVMERIREEFLASINGLNCMPLNRPVYTTQDGARVDASRVSPEYWYANLRAPVQFSATVSSMVDAGVELFVEVSPHAVLLHSIEECCEGRDVLACATLMRGRSGDEALSQMALSLYCAGISLNWKKWSCRGKQISAPTYPWQHRTFWLESSESQTRRLGEGPLCAVSNTHPLLGDRAGATSLRRVARISPRQPAFLSGHCIGEDVVFPATGYLEMCFEMAAQRFGRSACSVKNLQLHQALLLDGAVDVEFAAEESSSRFSVRSRPGVGRRWVVHASGEFRGLERDESASLSLDVLRNTCERKLDTTACYDVLRCVGYGYGAAFQQMSEIAVGNRQAFSAIRVPSGAFHFHPAALDAALQTLVVSMAFGEDGETLDGLYLPLEVEEVSFFHPPCGLVYAHASLREVSADYATGDIQVVDQQGKLLASLSGVGCRRVAGDLHNTVEQKHLLYETVWQEQPFAKGGSAAGTWVVYGRETPRGMMLEKLFGERTELRSFTKDADGFATDDLRGVIYVADAAVDVTAQCNALLGVVQHMLKKDLSTRLVILTHGVHDGSQIDAAALWGMARVIGNEHPELSVNLVDADLQNSDALWSVLADANAPQEVVLENDRQWVCRIQEYRGGSEEQEATVDAEESYRLIVDDPGRLKQSIRKSSRALVREDEIEICVKAAGINFKDILKARGLLAGVNLEGNYRGPWLGLECAGIVTAVGKQVQTLQVGDEVLAFAAGAFGRYVTTKAALAVRKPVAWSFDHAAAFPLVYTTAWYALKELARLQCGERVLIHAATGGVGQAAVQLAKAIGAEIYATAGSEEKRDFLQKQGIDRVFDSRNDSFVDGVLQATNGEGVDVVLNSLAGDLLTAGMEVLACFGRFVEIGKRDIDADHVLGLKPFQKNISFMSVDLDLLLFKRPESGQHMLQELMDFIHAEQREADLPVTVYPFSEYESAFKLLAQAGHVGKLVLSMSDQVLSVLPEGKHLLRRDATYLISGGLSGLGFQTAMELARCGAGTLALISRSGIGNEATVEGLKHLRRMGVQVHVMKADVTNSNDVKRVIECIASDLPPLRGVIHSANVYDDGWVRDMTAEQMSRVLDPKVRGAWLLHEYTSDLPLDYFVMYSSVSSTIGNVGQCNYAAANAYLEALATYRTKRGLPALTVNWGAVGGAGYVDQHADVAAHLERSGIFVLDLDDVFSALKRLVRDGAENALVVDADWQVVQARLAENARREYDAVAKDSSSGTDADEDESRFLSAIKNLPRAEQLECVVAQLQQVLADVLGYADGNEIDCEKGFFDMGLDSMMAMELNARLETLQGKRLGATVVFRYPSVQKLAEHLLEEMTEDTAESSTDEVRRMLELELDSL